MKMTMGKNTMELPSRELTTLRDSTDLLEDTSALQERLQEDGCLLLRGFHPREEVQRARLGILEELEKEKKLDNTKPKEEAWAAAGAGGAFYGGSRAEGPRSLKPFYDLVEHERVLSFFSRLFGEEAVALAYKWPRAVPPGGSTGAHYDNVYMGRGTEKLYTMWQPLGDISYKDGPLAISLGSHKLEKLKQTYGRMDVDIDHVETGWFTHEPLEMVDRFHTQWATTEFQMGDVLLFGMYTMHSSFNNESPRFRISADTRFQPASEPMDERWIGDHPKGHYAWGKEKPLVPVEEARRWWEEELK
ncbi:phytanoyl-CoA dioxygenase family protein [Alkalicoccus urumqiensis]|uniref:Phytanoyl-CoA dioxygenase n=1 Tax=Alkalicoccus urumqiensis TaxID=1548213 RepID=A0A2P6MHD3_ALKUR|nr:phytanoyl-CoA dioxygenase family protein [Alkalicoccus urumqiensis]PRO65705.1 phytanoyl-CoA dioxygenase [Alkalicoccus urumqiensis]